MCVCVCVCVCAQLYLTLCPPDSSVHGIVQARLLEWVAISYSNEILIKTLYLQARVILVVTHIHESDFQWPK